MQAIIGIRAKGVNNDLQKRIDELIRGNLVRSVDDENRKNSFGSKKWWDTVNRITGRKSKNSNISSVIDPQHINSYFQNVNTDANYISPQLIPIPVGTRVPTIDEPTVISFLSNLKRTAPGAHNYQSVQSINRTTMCPSDMEARQCEPFTQRISFNRV